MKTFLTTFVLAVAFVGCGKSPLLNHVNADELNFSSPRRTVTDSTAPCALWLEGSKLCASITWVTTPGEESDGELLLRFWNPERATEAGPFVDPELGTPFVQLWMPSMGHGSSPTRIAKQGPGEYRVTRVYFSMPGDWDIRVQLRRGSVVAEQTVLPFRY